MHLLDTISSNIQTLYDILRIYKCISNIEFEIPFPNYYLSNSYFMPQSRQLAAIMFTDIVGYTALMGNNEQKALEILNKNRSIHKPCIEKFNGRWIKEIGDGVLASFITVTEAVNAAINIQDESIKLNEFVLRIGIHLGEVISDMDDVFGDAVNIAARIQAIADPGTIFISESVYNNISNKQELNTRFVRQEILKNVKEPIKIYEVMPMTGTRGMQEVIKEKTNPAPSKSVAVLPFTNMSNDPDQEYFGDGIAEEIINSLFHIKDLKVAGRTSSAQFKGKSVDLREIGKLLGVSSVLEGSIRKQGNRIRITAQLINVEDGFHLFSEKYDRTMDDIFAIQDEIAIAITKQLKITLLGEDVLRISKSSTSNVKAYELYLKGSFYASKRGRFIIKAIECFNKAIEIDPHYTLAYIGLADAYFLSTFYGFSSGIEMMNKVWTAIVAAIDMDDSYAEAYCTLGQYYLGLKWDWAKGKENYLKSIKLNPNYAIAYAYYGLAIKNHIEGDFETAEKLGRDAILLEPLGAIYYADLSWILYNHGKYNEAIAIASEGIALDHHSFLSHQILGLAKLRLKHIDDAIDVFKNLLLFSVRHQYAVNNLAWAYCHKGDYQSAVILRDELLTRSQSEYISWTHLGLTEAWLGDVDKALEYLENGFIDRDPILVTIKYAPHVPPQLREDGRFQNLLTQIGFP